MAMIHIDPQELQDYVFKKGLYEGEITKLDDYVNPEGKRSLIFAANLGTENGVETYKKYFPMTGGAKFLTAELLKSLGVGLDFDSDDVIGKKVRIEFDDPRTHEGRTFAAYTRLVLVG